MATYIIILKQKNNNFLCQFSFSRFTCAIFFVVNLNIKQNFQRLLTFVVWQYWDDGNGKLPIRSAPLFWLSRSSHSPDLLVRLCAPVRPDHWTTGSNGMTLWRTLLLLVKRVRTEWQFQGLSCYWLTDSYGLTGSVTHVKSKILFTATYFHYNTEEKYPRLYKVLLLKKLTIQATLIYINCHTCHINRSSKLYPARNAFHIDKCVVPIFVLAPERRNVVTYKTRQERPKVAKELNWKVWKIWKLSMGRMDYR